MENPISRQHYGWSSIPQTTTKKSVVHTPKVCIILHMNAIISPWCNRVICTQSLVYSTSTKKVLFFPSAEYCVEHISISPYGNYCNSCCKDRKHCFGISEKAHDKRSLLLYRNVPATQCMSSVFHLFVSRKRIHCWKLRIRTKCWH